jgi:K+-sensing histidine kinase KdpD
MSTTLLRQADPDHRSTPEQTIAQLQRENTAMKLLVSAVQQLSLARTLDAVIAVVRHAARQLTGADGATFVLRDNGKCFYADEDAIAPLWKGQRFPMNACISGWAMLNGQVAVVEDIYADPRIPHDAYRPTFVKSLAMVPIRPESPIGAIGNYWANPHLASPHEIEILQALANTTAVALEDVALYGELERRVKQRTLQLEQINQELESFSYSVSHDLRAPLRHISGFVGALTEEYGAALDETAQNYISRINHGTAEMARLIEALLRLARFTRAEMKTQKIDLSAVVRDICARLRATEPARKAEFSIQENVQVCGDPGLLQAVMENLLSNAWKYSGKTEQALIQFGTVADPNGTSYFVRDNGVGFDMNYATRLFVPFQRLHHADEFSGNGVGLATVRRIVGRHGGRIWAEAAPGKGATFYFTLTPCEAVLPSASLPSA